MSKLHNKWLSPSEFKSQEEFLLKYNEELGYAKAVKDIITLIDNAGARVESISKKLQPQKNVI